MPLSWSLDHLGPRARTVAAAALRLGIIAGHDPRDATSSRRGVPYYERLLDTRVGGRRVGLPANYFFDGLDAAVDVAVRAPARTLAGPGAATGTARVPDPSPGADVWNVVAPAERAAVSRRVAR